MILVLASVTSFSQTTKTHTLFKDKSKFVILQDKSQIESIFSKNYKLTTLIKSDYVIIEDLFIPVIDSFNIKGEKRMRELARPYIKIDRNEFIIDTSRYKFQIIAVINHKGEKSVWINAFCNDHNMNWHNMSGKKNIVLVDDGGICYFNLTINLTTKKLLSFIINGDA